jgi:DNA-binding PadR family transcriptional regulator
MFKGLSWLIDTPSYGSLYPTLHALLEDQLVTVDVEPNEGKPPRKLYSITDAGRQALKVWLQAPTEQDLSIKTFVRQLIMAESLSADELKAYLVRRRSQVVSYLDNAEGENQAEMNTERQCLGQRLVHDYSATIAKAELAWLDTHLADLA